MSEVVLTGKFKHGSRKEVAELLQAQGITVAKSMKKGIDYLINGSFGSDAYSKGQYGSKHIKATQLGIKIASEDDFFNSLGNGAGVTDQIKNVDMNVAQADLDHNAPAFLTKKRPRLTRIKGLELHIKYVNANGVPSERVIGRISANPDVRYFFAQQEGIDKAISFRYDRITDAVDTNSGEVIGDVEEYVKGLLYAGYSVREALQYKKDLEEIRDIRRRAGLSEGIFGDYKKSWKITGALMIAKELGLNIQGLIEKDPVTKNHYYVKNAEMIDDLNIKTEAELATMLIIPYLEHVSPERLTVLADWVVSQAEKGKISKRFGMNFLKELGVV